MYRAPPEPMANPNNEWADRYAQWYQEERAPEYREAEVFAREVLCEMMELPDRTSPPDQPEMMLITEHELFNIIVEKLSQ